MELHKTEALKICCILICLRVFFLCSVGRKNVDTFPSVQVGGLRHTRDYYTGLLRRYLDGLGGSCLYA